MHKAHKIRLVPTNQQITYFMRASGTTRKTYNWALEEWNKQYSAHLENSEIPKPNYFALKKRFNALKGTEYPWMKEVTKCAPEAAFEDLNKAFQNFFKKNAKRPKFKSKNRDKLSFRVTNPNFKLGGKRIRIPNLGWVKMREELRFSGKLISATISQSSNQWFVSITVDVPDRVFDIPNKSVGIDLGIANLAILSTGDFFESPKFHKVELTQLRKLNKELSRRVMGSMNWHKTRESLRTLHARIARKRLDNMHKITTAVADRYSIIGVEDLNVAGMVKNKKLARAIQDQSFGEFKRQLQYKSQERNTHLVIVDRWFPSSKNCSDCGFKNQELTLNIRHWTCRDCGSVHDRDVNAAKNLEQEARRILNITTGGSSGIACGDDSSDICDHLVANVKLLSMKQESNS